MAVNMKNDLLALLQRIHSGAVTDDANLSEADRAIARRLYCEGLIWALPVEGSDAPVEALGLTETGRAYLTLPRPARVSRTERHRREIENRTHRAWLAQLTQGM